MSRSKIHRLHSQSSETWMERSAQAAALYSKWVQKTDSTRIHDLGCGDQKLKPLLEALNPDNCLIYRGYDQEPQVSNTHFINLNVALPAESADWAFCLGVFEYLLNPSDCMQRLYGKYKNVILSFVPKNRWDYSLVKTASMGWIHQLTESQIRQWVEAVGYKIIDERLVRRSKAHLMVLAR